ncbi:ATP-binding protein [Desulfonatronospira sp.]|uniref:sensor histidine kinase n=1 Tax=Desulfonatronospira sp. TaxID=1962951 RepID=UPI0025BF40D3|nr:ATP-binding protein [Desulfonatronospira sp.]
MLKKITSVTKLFSLRLALVVYVVLPLACILAITGYLVLNALERQVEQQMQNDLELVARSIQLPLSHALERDREGSMIQALESAFAIGRVYSANVYDKDGQEIASAGRTDPDPEKEKLTELAAEGERRGEFGHVAGQEVYSYFVPLTDSGGRISGLLQLTRRESDFKEDISAIRTKGIVGLGVAMFFMSSLVLYGHHKALGKYFTRLTQSMSRVAGGERRHRFRPRGPREIVTIGERFNFMLDSIEKAENEIRERRQAQEELQTRLRQAEKLAALGQLAAGVAHELGTPLSVISGKAQRAQRNNALPDELASTMQEIRQEVERMENIIRQLLDFSRRNEQQKRNVSMKQLARSAHASAEEEARNTGRELSIQEPDREIHIKADPTRIEQALVNLLKNALQSSSSALARISWGEDGGWAWFQVDDNGPGIPEDIKSKLFEPFFTTKSVGMGTGLGLAVVHGIAEEHNGSIEVGKSDMGGARFIIRLPVIADEQNRRTGSGN